MREDYFLPHIFGCAILKLMHRDVVLVDHQGSAIGVMEIFAAHAAPGHLHRAFSICVFKKNKQEILIKKRADKKPLFCCLWSNTCCSHPFPDEDVIQAGERRLQEELGFTCPLHQKGSFVYYAEDPKSGRVEYEHDTVLIGEGTGIRVMPNPQEVENCKWVPIDRLQKDILQNPKNYTPWFAKVLNIALQYAHA